MTTEERIKDLANKLNEEASYYGAYIDELRKAAEKPENEFIKECENIDLKYPKIIHSAVAESPGTICVIATR